MGNEYDYNEYLYDLGAIPYFVGMLDFTDPKYKDRQVNYQVKYMLDRTQKMFEYDGLPETIPARNLETILQTCGNVCLTEVNGKPYAFFGGLGGVPDEYYQPTIYTVANPGLKYDAQLKIGVDCVWGRSDSFGVGLMPLFQWYASMIIETGISLRVGVINSRVNKTISAEDDSTYKSALKYLEDIESGKLGVISDSAFFEGLNIHATPTANEHLTDIIESLQYLKASWFNDLGLNANYNMKRERIQSAEAENDNDALLPLIDDMLNQRREMLEKFNEMFGYNVTVKLSSSWEDVQEDDTESERDEMETENDSLEDPGEIETEPDSGAEDVQDREGESEVETNPDRDEMGEGENEPDEPQEGENAENITIIINNGDNNESTVDNGEEVIENDETAEDENTEVEGSMDESE